MKKLFRSMLALAFGAIAFTSCEDVPQPYDTPNGDEPTPVEGEYLNETFSTDFGKFEEVTIKGVPWTIDFSTAKASGYNSTDKTNTESQSFLVSPNVDLSQSNGAYLEFEYIFRYKSNNGRDLVLITDNYTGDPTTTEWKDITGDLIEGSDWNTFSKYSVNIPEEYLGKPNVRIALYYDASSKSSRTWEVKNLIMQDGQVETNVEPKEFDLNGSGGGGDTGEKGSYDDPYTVSEGIAKATAEGIYVKGYIVGFVSGQKYTEGATFNANGTVKTNILIAASANETDPAKCMPVQLPVGTIRDKINLVDNTGNLKQEVLLYGDIATYFSVPGIKNTSYAEINGQAIGTKPGGGGGDTGDTAEYGIYSTSSPEAGIYVIATPFASDQYLVAKYVDNGDKTFGYLNVEQATFANNAIKTDPAYEYTIAKQGNYYTIKDSKGRYYYMDGTYNNFNIATSLPSQVPDNYLWSITIEASTRSATIKNVGKNKTMYYKSDYKSYGAYETIDSNADLPQIFKKK